MHTFHAISGTIYPSGSKMGIIVKSIQADVADASATNVGILISGDMFNQEYHFNGITPVVGEYRFAAAENVHVKSSGSLDAVILEYIEYGDAKAYMREQAAQLLSSGVIAAGYYVPGATVSKKWDDSTVLSGSYAQTY